GGGVRGGGAPGRGRVRAKAVGEMTVRWAPVSSTSVRATPLMDTRVRIGAPPVIGMTDGSVAGASVRPGSSGRAWGLSISRARSRYSGGIDSRSFVYRVTPSGSVHW